MIKSIEKKKPSFLLKILIISKLMFELFINLTSPLERFELAIQLNKIEDAFKIAQKEGSNLKWKQVYLRL